MKYILMMHVPRSTGNIRSATSRLMNLAEVRSGPALTCSFPTTRAAARWLVGPVD